MRVLYDGEIFSLQPFGGVNRYFSSLISNLPSEFAPVLLNSGVNANLPDNRQLELFSFPRFGFWPGRLSFWLERVYFRTITAMKKIDLIHPTYYYMLLGENIKTLRKPIVVTLYDMLHEIFPDTVDQFRHHSKAKKKILDMASIIICISERTRRDLLEYYPQFESKAVVVHLGIDAILTKYLNQTREIEHPYFLYVGQRWSYKNFKLSAKVFSCLIKDYPELKLVICGPQITGEEALFFKQLGISDKVIHKNVFSDQLLANLYQYSTALVYPSLYEGFGLPPLEAMLCNTAVICSRSSSMPEVVGDAALLFDPRSEAELENRMRNILEQGQLRDLYIEKGLERVKNFSIQKMVSETVNVYSKLSGM
jgi:glycosyltransferase involved in cell wall biosynthesis